MTLRKQETIYRLLWKKLKKLSQEVSRELQISIVEESFKVWSTMFNLVIADDGTRLVVDNQWNELKVEWNNIVEIFKVYKKDWWKLANVKLDNWLMYVINMKNLKIKEKIIPVFHGIHSK